MVFHFQFRSLWFFFAFAVRVVVVGGSNISNIQHNFVVFFWFLEILFRLGRCRRPTNMKQQTAQNSRQNQTNYHNRSQSDVFGNGFLAHDNMNEEERRQKENKETKKKTYFQRSHAELNGGTAVELNSNGDDDDDVWRKMTTTSPRQRRRCQDDKLSIWNKKTIKFVTNGSLRSHPISRLHSFYAGKRFHLKPFMILCEN